MSGKDNAAKVDDSLGTNHSVVCCEVGQPREENQLLKLGFQLVTPGCHKTLIPWLSMFYYIP